MSKTLTIGATGRRHIVPSAVTRVEESTRVVLRLLFEESDARDVDVIVATGLAIGADSLIAQVALEERGAGSRVRLRAVLPTPREDYARDFRAEARRVGEVAERDCYYRLLARCDEVVELPIVAPKEDGTFSRTAQYSALGDYLVRESDLLVSFWSGDCAVVKPGGTVDVTLRKLRAIEEGQSSCALVVATPEERRVLKDGKKIVVPEDDEAAGKLAFLTSRPAANVDFASLAPLEELRAFLATKFG